MSAYSIQQEERLDEYKRREKEAHQRDADLRKMIKEEKAQHRELSLQARQDRKEEKKVFNKFVSAHDEKLVLRSHAKQVELSPRSSI